MKVTDTKLEIKGKGYKNTELINVIKDMFLGDSYLVVLWDNFNGSYGLMISVRVSNYPIAADSNEDYFFVVESDTLDVQFEDDERCYPKELKNLNSLSKTVLNILSLSRKLYLDKDFDCIILDTRMGRIIGTGVNTKEDLFDIEETSKCKNILYISV